MAGASEIVTGGPPATGRPASLLARAARVWRLVRVRGLRRTVRAGVQAYLWSRRSWFIFTRALRSEGHKAPSSDFEYRVATLADLDLLAAFEPNRSRREFRAWIEGGALVFLALHEGRPVAFHCLAFAVPTGAPLNRLTLAPDQVWTVDVQTLPAYRRHRVADSLRAFREPILLARGVRRYLSSVQDDNDPALVYALSAQRPGDRVDLLSYTCFLGFRRIRIEENVRPELERRLRSRGVELPPAR